MVVRAAEVPPSHELAAHLDTAFDAARHWVQRGLYARQTDERMWENATYFPRVLLTRANDNHTQLGYALHREYFSAPDEHERWRLASAGRQWQQADPELTAARAGLQDVRDTRPDDPQARAVLAEVKAHLDRGAEHVRDMLDLLATGRDPDRWPPVGRHLSVVPEPDDERSFDHELS